MKTIFVNLRYWLDNLLARGTGVLLMMLGAVLLCAIIALTAIMLASNITVAEGATWVENLWTVFIFTFDPTGVPISDGTWGYRILMLVASLGGVFILSTLIGILTTGFAEGLDRLRKGKSVVMEKEHSIVLGWGEQVYSVIDELSAAGGTNSSATIVILADMDKVQMQDLLRNRVQLGKNKRVIVRSGSPLDISDLQIVRPSEAKNIIILDDQQKSGAHNDANAVKSLLALQHVCSVEQPVVATTMYNQENIDVARIVATPATHIVNSTTVVAQIIAQSCRQPGLAQIYSELLGFGGDEFYIVDEPLTINKSFGDVVLMYNTSSVVGIRRSNGTVELNPPTTTLFESGDAVIAISAEKKTMVMSSERVRPLGLDSMVEAAVESREIESILIVGWNARAPNIIRELLNYVQSGSNIKVLSGMDLNEPLSLLKSQSTDVIIEQLTGATLSHKMFAKNEIEQLTSIVVLADTQLAIQEADAQTLLTLIHLRDIVLSIKSNVNIVTEMLDERNRSLIAVSSGNDFVISSTFTSLLLTQIAENPELATVFNELFTAEGNEIYLRPANLYVKNGAEVNYATIVVSGQRRGEVVIGLRYLKNGEYVVRINPAKEELLILTDADMVIVVSR